MGSVLFIESFDLNLSDTFIWGKYLKKKKRNCYSEEKNFLIWIKTDCKRATTLTEAEECIDLTTSIKLVNEFVDKTAKNTYNEKLNARNEQQTKSFSNE